MIEIGDISEIEEAMEEDEDNESQLIERKRSVRNHRKTPTQLLTNQDVTVVSQGGTE